jgi:hypothetical protein
MGLFSGELLVCNCLLVCMASASFCLFPALEGFARFVTGWFFVFVFMGPFSGELLIEGGSPEDPQHLLIECGSHKDPQHLLVEMVRASLPMYIEMRKKVLRSLKHKEILI